MLSAYSYSVSHINNKNNKIADSPVHLSKFKVDLATLVEGEPKAPFLIATTPRGRGGCYSIP